MKIKRILRLVAFALFVALACVVPFPINLFRKEDLKKAQIELVEKQQEIEENEDENYKL